MSKSTKSKSTKRRTFVPNTTSAIVAACGRKRLRVQADSFAVETELRDASDSTTISQGPIAASSVVETELRDASDSTTIPQGPIADDVNIEDQPTITDVPKKKQRGRSRGLNADKALELHGKKLLITVEERYGRPVGTYAEMFASEIGFTVRNHAPLNVEKWKHITTEELATLVKRLSKKFDMDMSDTWVCRYVHRTFSSCFTNFRNKLSKYFKTFPTKEATLQKRHKEVNSDAEWAFLCDLFSSEKFNSVSEKNAANRSKLTYHHKAGSKSFMSHEAAQAGQTLSAIERFENKYKSKTKGWDLGAKPKFDEMVRIRTETTQEDGTRTLTDDEIYKQVFGSKSGYSKGCGFGPRPTPDSTSQSSIHEMYEKNKALEEKIKTQNEQMKALEERTKNVEELMAKFTGEQLQN